MFVYDDHVVATALHGDFNIVLDDEDAMPVEIAEILGEKIDARHSEMMRGRCGSDGHRSRSGRKVMVFVSPVKLVDIA